ncbi:MAG: hypothetical protein ACRD2G_02220 [Terriglobia bacterium]
MSPQRKADKNGQEHAARRTGQVERRGSGLLTNTICFKRELAELYRGADVFRCGCPLCAPEVWCVAYECDGRICEHARYDEGEARRYPFCYYHYKKYVDCWPKPSAAKLKALREWAAAGAKKSVEFSEIGKFAGTSEIYRVFVAREAERAKPCDIKDAQLAVSRLVGKAAAGGKR